MLPYFFGPQFYLMFAFIVATLLVLSTVCSPLTAAAMFSGFVAVAVSRFVTRDR